MRSSLCSESDRIWASRYIREAKVDLSLANDLKSVETVRETATLAMRKAQLAVQHAMGTPDCSDPAIAETNTGRMDCSDSLVRVLIKIGEITRELSELEPTFGKGAIVSTAKTIVDTAESIVETLAR